MSTPRLFAEQSHLRGTSREKYYKEFALSGVPYSELKQEEHANLYVKPKKEKKSERPRVIVWIANAVQQADLLSMPIDESKTRGYASPRGKAELRREPYKYILTVVDVSTRTVDTEPLESKEADEVLKAFKAIYKRGRLKPPSVRLEVDNGGEFKSVVKDYFVNEIGVHIRYGKPGRHKQQCYAECANGLIGEALHQRMSAQEMLTGEPSREWIDDLPIITKALNRRWKRKPPPRPEGLPKFTKKSGDLLLEGTRVRVALDEPRGVPGEKLPGKFRASDIRWDPKIHIIKKAILSPEQPPTYLVDGPHGKLKVSRCAYTRKNLQVVPDNERPPPDSVIRGQPKRYVPEKILKTRTRKGRKEYLVKWKRYPEDKATWEPANQLEEDTPNLISEFLGKKMRSIISSK
jgi:hypothetical protein